MGQRDGFPISPFMTVQSGASPFQMSPNMTYRVTSGSSSQVKLPNNPPPGSMAVVYKNVSNNNVYTVTPQGGATIEGSPGLALRTFKDHCILQYDGTNWDIWYTDPALFPVVIGNGALTGIINPPAATTPTLGLDGFIPRTGNARINLGSEVYGGSPAFPCKFGAGLTGIDISIQAPFFSAGVFKITQAFFFISDIGQTNTYLAVLGTQFTMGSGTTASPGAAGMPLLTSAADWTVTIGGADLSTDVSGTTVDSAAGGIYFFTSQLFVQTNGLVP